MTNRLIQLLESKSKVLIFNSAVVGVLVVGFFDYLTGFEISFAFFYTLPVSLAAWGAGKWMGTILSFFSAIVWLSANYLAGETYPNLVFPIWNSLTRFGFFFVITLLMAELRDILDKEKRLARTDDLTHVLNRRAFYEAVDYELERVRRYPRPLTMVYFDLDGFKNVNDEKGHAEGDRLLVEVSSTILHQIRSTDILGRLGGDEFAILLPETDPLAAQLVVPRLHRVLVNCMQTNDWSVTFSIGVLSCFEMPVSADQLVSLTDQLMYEVKANGKNAMNFAVYHA